MSEVKGLYVLKRKGGLSDAHGMSGRPRMMYGSTKDDEGIDGGEYDGKKFPSAKEDITPKFCLFRKKWDFYGDSADLKKIVKAVGLYYEKDHPRAGDIIEQANLVDSKDPFFNHSFWMDNPMIMEGSSKLINADNPEEEFLARCYLGNRYTEGSDEGRSSASAKYQVYPTATEDTEIYKEANVEIDLVGELSKLNSEKRKQISVVLGLIHTLKSPVVAESVAPNLLAAIKKTSPNPGERRIFEGKSYQTFFKELVKDDNTSLNKKVNIRLGINTNTLRYKDGAYNLKGKKLSGVESFSDLYKHFDDNPEDYATLLDAIK
jgi:hypothetical protein